MHARCIALAVSALSIAPHTAFACDVATLDCGPTTAAEFVPRSGVFAVGSHGAVRGRFIFSSFRWNSESEMLALPGNESSGDFRTLEPDVLTTSALTYVGAIKRQDSLTTPTIVQLPS